MTRDERDIPEEECSFEEGVPGVDAERDLECLCRRLEEARREADSYRDSLARWQADYQNLKKRNQRRMEQLRNELRGETVCRFLPVIDELQLVLESTSDRPEDPVRKGVEMVLARAEDALADMGVCILSCVGEEFDPHLHEAMDYVPVDDCPDGQIIEEIRAGYEMEDRLLRPARVRVARGTTNEQCDEENGEEQ